MAWKLFGRSGETPAPPPPLDLSDPAHRGKEDPARDAELAAAIPALCADWFPDNAHNTWHIEATAHQGERSWVRVHPEPNDVGYDRIVMLVIGGDAAPTALAVWAEEAPSTFELHSTDASCPDDIPRSIRW